MDQTRSAIESYDAWNAEIFAYHFGPSKSGRDIRLTLDDATASLIGDRLDLTVTEFISSVAVLLRPGSTDVFAKYRALASRATDIPSTVALLGAQVLVASRMSADATHTAQAFWPRFNRLLLGVNEDNPPRGHEFLGECWRALEQFLNTFKGGTFGILRLPADAENSPLLGRRHINYPLSQCLVREVDRGDLSEFFIENPVARDCRVDQLLGLISQSIYAFSKTFAATIRQARSSPSYASELLRVVVEVRSHLQIEGHESGAVGGTRKPRIRLRFFQRRGSYCLVLQQLLDEWHNMLELSASDWESGLSDERGDTLWSGAEFSVLVETPDGYVTSKDRLQHATRIRLLARLDVITSMMDWIRTSAQCDGTAIDLSSSLEGLQFVAFEIEPVRDGQILERLGIAGALGVGVQLEGGLDLGRRRFVLGAPPRIRIRGGAGSHARINGDACNTDSEGIVRLDQTPSAAGDFVVEVEQSVTRYNIVDLSTGLDSRDGCQIGYALSLKDAILLTDDLTESSPRLPEGTKYLVGADI